MTAPSLRRIGTLWLLASVMTPTLAPAAATDIASEPLITTVKTLVKPNVMFVLDDSGSMAWDFMPDDADFGTDGFNSIYGRRAAQCNGLAYNPANNYDLPVDAAGADVTAASMNFLSGTYTSGINYLDSGSVNLTTKRHNLSGPASITVASSGTLTVTLSSSQSDNSLYASSYFVGKVVTVYGGSSGSTRYMIGKVTGWNTATRELTINIAMSVGSGNLSGTFWVATGSPIDNVYYTYSGGQTPALDYRYPGNSLDASTTFYKECSSAFEADPGRSVFNAVIVTPGSAEAQKYANWYYNYSTRMRMMKTSLSRAFKELDDKYRVGYSTINEGSASVGLDIADFNSTHKTTFYSKFNAAVPSGNTPLRRALSKVGRYYANKLTGQTDPVQYSCQKNFTILSTDGYWNSTAGVKLDGTSALGQQDGGATPRPMYDGGTATEKTIEKWNVTSTLTRTTVTPYTKTDITATTSYTPVSGESYKTYTLGPVSTSFNNADINRSCSQSWWTGLYDCTVTVRTSSNHGFSAGQTITVAGVTPSVYNGSFSVSIKDNNEYRYTLSGLASAPSTPTNSNRGTSSFSAGSCPVGQGVRYEQLMTRDKREISTSGTQTVSSWTSTQVQTVTTVTPYTRTITVVDGKQLSDVTTAGTASTTTSTGTTSTSAVTTNTTPYSKDGGTDYTAWVAKGAPVDKGCASSAGSNTAVVSGATTTAVVSANANSAGSPVAGAKSISDGPATESVGTKTTSSSSSTSGGSTDSLSDVAMYYYKTDLRDSGESNCTGALGKSVCENNVKPLGKDDAAWQHMTTFTLSLGLNGTLKYDPNYETQASGDFYKLTIGDLNWPIPSSNAGAVNIDDLWHAAVNGRGRYFSANNPTTLAASLAAALNSVGKVLGASSAAATSTLQPVEGDSGVFIAQFESVDWTGDLRAYDMNTTTGAVVTSVLDSTTGKLVSTAKWSAADKLTPTTNRTIYYFKGGGAGFTGALREFTYANLTADSLNTLFDNACTKTPALSQCPGLNGEALDAVNSGANMVSFLRGQSQPQYRVPARVLGDIVNSSPVFVRKPSFQYTENGYGAFKTTHASRAPTLYVGANDGMLHAFNADDGTERWAYMPRLVMDKVYRLGDAQYGTKHLYTVDATPSVGDIYAGGSWRTILVGGLNAGGSGYYALDVTDPANPVALWEFTDANLGLSYGNPVITKRKDGKWVVAFGSGHNNADGEGHLFVVDALTGELLKDIKTGAGAAGSPSGLSKLNGWIDSDADNTTTRFYAGDLQGNIWRFDIDGNLEPKNSAFKLAQLLVGGVPQPITTQLQLAEIEANGGKHVVVYAGTGRYLGKSDVAETQVQSIYAIKDALTADSLGDVRGGGTLVKQTVATSGNLRTIDPANPVDWSVKNGWYVDLADSGERVNVDMQLAFNVLTAAGNVPGTTATDCDEAGKNMAWIYQLDVVSGKMTQGSKINSMVAGLSTVQLSSGAGVTVVTKTDATDPESKKIDPSALSAGKARRSAWRELID